MSDLIGRRGREALHVCLPLLPLRQRELGHAEHDVDAEVPKRGEVRLLAALPGPVRRSAPPPRLVDGPRDGGRDGARAGGAAREAAAGWEVEDGLRRVAAARDGLRGRGGGGRVPVRV